ncbi:MAG: succinoglycan biosynthesis protein exop, partial [Rhizobiaceae bacterium]|nr:succinoglycan biosynthesis protein exop [Rhizobiaceae bacterium]
MFESKASNRLHPDEAAELRAFVEAGRHGYFDRGEDGYLIAANVPYPETISDAQLLDIIQRMLDGDPYPVSGGNAPAMEASDAEQPLADRIRGILQARPARTEAAREETLETTADFSPDPNGAGDVYIDLPSVDLLSMPAVATVSRRRLRLGIGSIVFVVVASLSGALIPTMLAAPPRYASQTILQVQAQGNQRQAILDFASKRALSPSVLSDIVAKLKLDRDPEFTGDEAGAFGVAMDLLAGSGGASDAPSRAQVTLRNDVVIAADPATGTLRLSVTTGDPARSAEIANRLADATVYGTTIAQGAALPANTPADKSRKALDQAKAALSAFRAQVGDDKIEAALEMQQQRQQLDAAIKDAGKAVQSAKSRLAAAKSATPTTILNGTASGDLSSPALDDLRSRYSAANTVLSQLSAQLGPRHPRLQAQQATVDGLAADIRSQLQRLVIGSDASLKAALDTQATLSTQMTALSRKSIDVDMARLAQLQDEVTAAQSRYDNDLQNSDVAARAEIEAPIAVAVPAIAEKMPLDDHLAGRQVVGFLIGLSLSLGLVFLWTWLNGSLAAEDATVDPLPPFEPVLADGDERADDHPVVEPIMTVRV